MRAEAVIDVLADLFAVRGVPKHVRSDNGPEFIAAAIRRWLGYAAVETLYIEPGSPWENGYAESLNSRFRDELLAREEFEKAAGSSWSRDLVLTGVREARIFRCMAICPWRRPCAI